MLLLGLYLGFAIVRQGLHSSGFTPRGQKVKRFRANDESALIRADARRSHMVDLPILVIPTLAPPNEVAFRRQGPDDLPPQELMRICLCAYARVSAAEAWNLSKNLRIH